MVHWLHKLFLNNFFFLSNKKKKKLSSAIYNYTFFFPYFTIAVSATEKESNGFSFGGLESNILCYPY